MRYTGIVVGVVALASCGRLAFDPLGTSGPVEGSPCQVATDCDDHDPCTVESCDLSGGIGACAFAKLDADSDGFASIACGGTDCDDTSAAATPANVEGPSGGALCSDGRDNDCDGDIDAADPGCAMTADMTGVSQVSFANAIYVEFKTFGALLDTHVVVGSFCRDATAANGTCLVELDRLGAVVWEQALFSSNIPNPYDIRPTSDGGFVAAGIVATGSNNWEASLFKFNADHTLASTYSYYDSAHFALEAWVAESASNGFLVGVYNSGQSWVMEIGASGSVLWSKNNSMNDVPFPLGAASDGGSFVQLLQAGVNAPLHLMHLDPAGNQVWARDFPAATAVHAGNGHIYVAVPDSTTMPRDVILSELDESGSVLSSHRIGTAAQDDVVTEIASSGAQRIVLHGSSAGSSWVAEVRTDTWTSTWRTDLAAAGSQMSVSAGDGGIWMMTTPAGSVTRLDAQGWLWGTCQATARNELAITDAPKMIGTPSSITLADVSISRRNLSLSMPAMGALATETCAP